MKHVVKIVGIEGKVRWFLYDMTDRHTGEVLEHGKVPGDSCFGAIADMYVFRNLNPKDVEIHILECLGVMPEQS